MWLLLGFLIVCLLGGGSSRPDVLSLFYLRPAALLCLGGFALSPGTWNFRLVRIPLLLLGSFAVWMVLQLIPLPPALWIALPGHAHYAQAAVIGGFAEVWHPISLTPDLTVNSLLALLPAFVALVGLAGLSREQRMLLVPAIILCACLSALAGVVQLSSGEGYTYALTSEGVPVGLFANRNHQAVFLATTLPMLAIWARMPAQSTAHYRARVFASLAIGLFLIPMILVTGSRAGMLLGLLGVFAGIGLAPRVWERGTGRTFNIVRTAFVAAPILLVLLTLATGRALAIQRLFWHLAHEQQEQRVEAAPIVLRMVRDFFPFGSGFGSFDSVYREYEPDAALHASYFNHAHNDLFEMLLTGGLVPAVIFFAFCIWYVAMAVGAVRNRAKGAFVAFLGAVVVIQFLLASLVDYPLRTPLLSMVFVIGCGWLTSVRVNHEAR